MTGFVEVIWHKNQRWSSKEFVEFWPCLCFLHTGYFVCIIVWLSLNLPGQTIFHIDFWLQIIQMFSVSMLIVIFVENLIKKFWWNHCHLHCLAQSNACIVGEISAFRADRKTIFCNGVFQVYGTFENAQSHRICFMSAIIILNLYFLKLL